MLTSYIQKIKHARYEYLACEDVGFISEGAGSRYQRYLITYILARNLNIKYLHIPSKPYSGHYVDIDIDVVEKNWLSIFGFLTECESENRVNIGKLDNVRFIKKISFSEAYKLVCKLPKNKLENSLESLRDTFSRWNERTHLILKKSLDATVIAIHLRALNRGDGLDGVSSKLFVGIGSFPWQFFNCNYGLPDNNPTYYADFYANGVNQICESINTGKIILRIHSTANESTFDYFKSLLDPRIDVEFYIGGDPVVSIMDFIYSDFFIASHSSMSWVALLLRVRPSYIRRGFRQFLPSNVMPLDEILYEKDNPVKNFVVFFIKLLSYARFYPRYYWRIIVDGPYFKIKRNRK